MHGANQFFFLSLLLSLLNENSSPVMTEVMNEIFPSNKRWKINERWKSGHKEKMMVIVVAIHWHDITNHQGIISNDNHAINPLHEVHKSTANKNNNKQPHRLPMEPFKTNVSIVKSIWLPWEQTHTSWIIFFFLFGRIVSDGKILFWRCETVFFFSLKKRKKRMHLKFLWEFSIILSNRERNADSISHNRWFLLGEKKKSIIKINRFFFT